MNPTWKQIFDCVLYYQRKTVTSDITIRHKLMSSFTYSERFTSADRKKDQLATIVISTIENCRPMKLCKLEFRWTGIRLCSITVYDCRAGYNQMYKIKISGNFSDDRDIFDKIHPDIHTVFEYLVQVTLPKITGGYNETKKANIDSENDFEDEWN